MILQIALGSLLLLLSILIAGVSLWFMEGWFVRSRPWLASPPHRPKLLVTLGMFSIWVLAQLTAGVWLWALTFRALGLFETMEPAVYFSLVSFTTLGFGDILLPDDWRILGGMAAANGLLNFGLLTAVMVEAVRQLRLSQIETLKQLE